MKWIVLGALAAALAVLCPALGAAVLGVTVTLVSQPVALAFGLGLAAGARARAGGWTR